MMYLTPQSTPPPNLAAHYGQLLTVAGWLINPSLPLFGVDNGVFTAKFDGRRFLNYLDALKPHQSRCLFVVAPDIVGECHGTLAQFKEWYPRLRADGWPVAYAAQDGSETLPLPECQAVFIGGSTEWKLGAGALEVIHAAKSRGLWIHVGRVNSQRRIRHFQLAGVNSVDGTTIAFSPDDSRRVLDAQLFQPPLWSNL